MSDPVMFTLDPSEEVTHWYNIVADLPTPPPPPLHPGTHQPVGPDDLAPLFPMELIAQEVTGERYVEIPEPVLEVYRQYRPSPLYRARRWEQRLGTRARIYYKYEGVSPAGSHKTNTAIPQVYYNVVNGTTRLTTETGAGQWGTALSYACSLFGAECEVWQVGASYDTKPQRRTLIEVFGGKVHRSPSRLTEAGRAFPADHTGSLGIAISEAVEMAAKDEGAKYALGSVLNHVVLHQTVIGEEALRQLAKAGETKVDLVVGCAGGGSNFAGLAFPFLREKLAGTQDPRILAVEPTSCPTLTRGEYRYDFGDTAGLTPLMKMYTLGHDFVPSPIHAGGLRYHGMAPLVSHAVHEGLVEATALHQRECFEAAVEFARTQGVVAAPESSHALAQARREALAATDEQVIVIGLSGHGLLELGAYESFLAGRLEDDVLSDADLDAALAGVPTI
ncbi:TrpB-like pyridoxal phosphate-dependent enzyme [Nocardioides dongxiaopingii]|uniref:TrpB-like pyridoxal phosphate-dependent enzyme n=1 Tax=Nocardioides sp. S-1144 TaxID=2582905 RepID=UPI00110F51A0|nr:TrpB-like pyridoxal phosphate-dependent enzyme [Nocardioides sp. S-1144]QCW49238.1 TrpB-like pyridoxal phosphate-dependent enzyme [Nocardioides sp. S-1144]